MAKNPGFRCMRVTSPSHGAAQVRTEFRISDQGDLPHPTAKILGPTVRVADHYHQACSAMRAIWQAPPRRFRRASRHAPASEEALLAPLAVLHRTQPTGAPLDACGAGFGGRQSSSLPLRTPRRVNRRMPSPWTTTQRCSRCSRCAQARRTSTRPASVKQGYDFHEPHFQRQRLPLTGRSRFTSNACVDNSWRRSSNGDDAKRKKRIKPPNPR